MQPTDEAVSNCETRCMNVSTLRFKSESDKTQNSNMDEYGTCKHNFLQLQ